MYYLLHINNFLVKNEKEEYDFLYEMYQPIKELYLKVWYLKNISSSKNKNEQINQLNEKIKNKLQIYNIPEYIILRKEDNEYVEPISNISFNLSNLAIKQEFNKKDAEKFINKLKQFEEENNSSFFKNDLFKFNEIIKNSKEKIK